MNQKHNYFFREYRWIGLIFSPLHAAIITFNEACSAFNLNPNVAGLGHSHLEPHVGSLTISAGFTAVSHWHYVAQVY